MKDDRSTMLMFGAPLAAGVLVLAALLWFGIDHWRLAERTRNGSAGGPGALPTMQTGGADAGDEPPDLPEIQGTSRFDAVLDALLTKKVQDIGAIANEAILRFKTKEAYEAFLKNSGLLKVLGKLDALNAVRVGYDDISALRKALLENDSALEDLSANYLVKVPQVPEKEDRTGGAQPFNDDLMAALGITGNHMTWGQGSTVAVLDTGVGQHPALQGVNVTHLDLVGDGQALDGHGTAMATLIAGRLSGAEGIAPAADILDVRIAGADGESDSFLLATGIQMAADRGAQVINVSMGSYGDAAVVQQAVNYALGKGVTIVAAAGNEQVNMLAWPAAYPGVVSVSAVDALGDIAYFSNSGNPTLAAPGVGIPSGYVDGGQAGFVYGNGTSQATALVSGYAAQLAAQGKNPATTITNYARPTGASTQQVGAGVLYVGPK